MLLFAALSLAATSQAAPQAPGHAPARAPESAPESEVDFTRDILPILRERCYRCHGPEGKAKAGLRLVSRARLLAGGESGPVLDEEDPGSSLILAMVRWQDELHQMPPDGKLGDAELAVLERWVLSGAPWDPSAEIEVAEEPESAPRGRGDGMEGWSYRPLVRPSVPAIKNRAWVRTPLDAFVLARLEAAGLEPAPEASRETLCRRATYDLTGLPPTPEEVAAFVDDPRPDAYERLVDRLLASPHYGEAWGRRWLDVVRYAETNGFERDTDKPWIWRYRDWVVRAFDQDLPFDRFALMQLAGDELDRPDQDALIATGYYRLMPWDDEPGQGVLQARYDVLDDIASTTAQAFLGMTIGCARCHDHKGDPIPQEDYYRFLAIFHGVTDMTLSSYVRDVSTPEEKAAYQARVDAHAEKLAASRNELLRFERDVHRRILERDLGGPAPPDLENVRWQLYEGSWERLPEDLSGLVPVAAGRGGERFDPGVARRSHDFIVSYRADLRVRQAGRHQFAYSAPHGARIAVGGELLAQGVRGGIGAAELEPGLVPIAVDWLHRDGSPELFVRWTPQPVPDWRWRESDPGPGWQEPAYDDSSWRLGPAGFGTRGTPGARVGTVWRSPAIWLRRSFDWPGEAADLVLAVHHDDDLEVFLNGLPALERSGYQVAYETAELSEAARAALLPTGNVLAVACRQTGGGQFVDVEPIDRRFLAAEPPDLLAGGWRSLSLAAPRREVTGPDPLVVSRGREVATQEEIERYLAGVEAHAKLRAEALEIRPVLAATVQERQDVPPTYVLVRGNAAVHGPRVEPGLPRVLGGQPLELAELPPGAHSQGLRRAFAEWLISDEDPLLARVTANRVFLGHFQRALVATPNDFGELGARPTDPALLDWLASELRDGGWSLKALHRLIMTSSAYRMSSVAPAGALELDPENRLGGRFQRRRLLAEEVRDSMLSAAGVLNLALGGPSVFGRMPAEALATSSRPDQVWGTSPADQRNRRSLYIKVKRSLITPLFEAFDVADTDASCPRRFETVQPSQALALLNGELAHEMAARMAERLEAEVGEDPARQVQRGLELVLGRAARPDELDSYVAWMEASRREEGISAQEALRDFCLLTFNLNEFLYVD